MAQYTFINMVVPYDTDHMQCMTMYPLSGYGFTCQWLYKQSAGGKDVTSSLLLCNANNEQLHIEWEHGELVITVPRITTDSPLSGLLEKDGALWCALGHVLLEDFDTLMDGMKTQCSERVVGIVERWFRVVDEHVITGETVTEGERTLQEECDALKGRIAQMRAALEAERAMVSTQRDRLTAHPCGKGCEDFLCVLEQHIDGVLR